MASQTTGALIIYSTVCSAVDQRKQQSPASLAITREIHQRPVNSPHKGPVARRLLPFDGVSIICLHVIAITYIANLYTFHDAIELDVLRMLRGAIGQNLRLFFYHNKYYYPEYIVARGIV